MISLLRLALIGAALASLSLHADPTLLPVEKTDGSIGYFKLLPITHEPAHEQVVQGRMALALAPAVALPKQYQIPAQYLSAVRDQGLRSTCAQFVTLGILESRYLRRGKRVNLSEECLAGLRNWMYDYGYTGADKPRVRPDSNGDLPGLIIQTLRKYGVPVEKAYPTASCHYDGRNINGNVISLASYQSALADPANPASAYGKDVAFHHNTSPTLDQVKTLLNQNLPVAVGILVYKSFSRSIDWVYTPSRDNASTLTGGHAVILTGYHTLQNGKTIFTFKNSWGKNWGRSGYGTMDDGLLLKSWSHSRSIDFVTAVN